MRLSSRHKWENEKNAHKERKMPWRLTPWVIEKRFSVRLRTWRTIKQLVFCLISFLVRLSFSFLFLFLPFFLFNIEKKREMNVSRSLSSQSSVTAAISYALDKRLNQVGCGSSKKLQHFPLDFKLLVGRFVDIVACFLNSEWISFSNIAHGTFFFKRYFYFAWNIWFDLQNETDKLNFISLLISRGGVDLWLVLVRLLLLGHFSIRVLFLLFLSLRIFIRCVSFSQVPFGKTNSYKTHKIYLLTNDINRRTEYQLREFNEFRMEFSFQLTNPPCEYWTC